MATEKLKPGCKFYAVGWPWFWPSIRGSPLRAYAIKFTQHS